MKTFNNSIFLLLFFVSCLGSDSNIHKTAYDLLKANQAIILDVRERGELTSNGIVKGAKWVATSEIKNDHQNWKDFYKGHKKEIPIYTYCAVGFRANRAASALKEMGFKAINLGGLSDLKKSGLPIIPFKE